MKYVYLPIIFAFAMAAAAPLHAQCYPNVRAEGLRLLRNGQYSEAINQFWAARTCDDLPANNDIDKLIQQATKEQVANLNTAVEKARQAEQDARKAQQTAVNAREAEAEARKKAEDNARLAREEGQRAESLRLSLLSDIARQNNQYSDALLLAFFSLELAANPDMQNAVLPSFAKAVKDSLTRTIATLPQSVSDLYPSTDGQWIAAQTANDVFLCQLSAGKIAVTHLPGQQWLCFAGPDGQQLTVTRSSQGNEASIWRDGIPTPLRGHAEPVTYATASPDGQLFITTSRDNTAKIWDATGRLQATLSGHKGNVYAAQFSPDKQQILTRSSDGNIGLWHTNGQLIAMLGDNAAYFYHCAFSPSGNRIAGASAMGLMIWDKNGRQIAAFGQDDTPVVDCYFSFENNEQRLRSRSLSNLISQWDLDGKKMASFSHNGRVDGWDATNGQGSLITWSEDRQVKQWSHNGKLLQTYSGHTARIVKAESGLNLILGACEDGNAKLWTSDGTLLLDWNSPTPPHLSTPDHLIFYTDNTGTKLLATPTPVEVYKTMRDDASSLTASLEKIRKKYKVARFEQ